MTGAGGWHRLSPLVACLTQHQLRDYLAGNMEYHAHSAADAHIDQCNVCNESLEALAHQPAMAAAGGSADKPTAIHRRPEGTRPAQRRPAASSPERDELVWLERHYGLTVGDVVDNKFRIDRLLGEGAMGIVVAATHLVLRKPVAIKFMHPSMSKKATNTARFMREARAAARLKEEHVARVLDMGQIESVGPYIVLELLEGIDLLRYLKTNRNIAVDDALELTEQAANGVAAAHRAGIIHRDIKPSNLFMTERSDGSRMIKVLDFGVSKYIEGDSLSVTSTSTVVGSPTYMAPELFQSAQLATYASDVWALGVLLYRMIGGKLPFEGSTLPEVVSKIHFGKPTPIMELRPGLAPDVAAIINRCLAPDPRMRYPSAAELGKAIKEVRARPAAAPQMAPTGPSQHRTVMATASMIQSNPIPVEPPSFHQSHSNLIPVPPSATSSSQVNYGEASHVREGRSRWIGILLGVAAAGLAFGAIVLAGKQYGAKEDTDTQTDVAPAAAGGDTAAGDNATDKPAAASGPVVTSLDAGTGSAESKTDDKAAKAKADEQAAKAKAEEAAKAKAEEAAKAKPKKPRKRPKRRKPKKPKPNKPGDLLLR